MGLWLDYARPSGEMVDDASASRDGFMSAADKTKLDSIPAGGGGGDDGTRLVFASLLANHVAPYSFPCPVAVAGDTVVTVLAYGDTPTNAITGAGSNNYNSWFESTISVSGFIKQNLQIGQQLARPLLIVLKRAV